MKELLMRMEVFLRRTKKLQSDQMVEYRIGKLRFLFNDLKIFNNNEVSNLTQKEADLLKFLCEHPNRILRREEVLLNVWGKDDYFLAEVWTFSSQNCASISRPTPK
jgi:DNA-binding response OmpR family regulator